MNSTGELISVAPRYRDRFVELRPETAEDSCGKDHGCVDCGYALDCPKTGGSIHIGEESVCRG